MIGFMLAGGLIYAASWKDLAANARIDEVLLH